RQTRRGYVGRSACEYLCIASTAARRYPVILMTSRAPAEFICLGDLHIGRPPTRIPDVAYRGGQVASARDLSPAAAWKRAVDAAIARNADAMLLLGDVVDAQNDLYEASGPIRTGVEQLAAA